MPTETETFQLKLSEKSVTVSEVIIEIIRRQGILGIVLMGMMYFIYTSENQRFDMLVSVIERNTEAFTKHAVNWERMESKLERLDALTP